MDETLLKDKRCLVTGGSRNLGRKICIELARQGARVAFTFRERESEAERTVALVEEEAAGVLSFRGDVADADHVDETVSALEEAWGGVDVLVNNAALTQMLPIGLLEEADWDRVMATNVKGAYLFSRAILRGMIREKSGVILNIGSFAAKRIVGAPVHYAASKAALQAFSNSLANEVGRYGIRVLCLSPGLMEVGMSQRLPGHHVADFQSQAALNKLVDSEDVARAAAWLVSDENTFMTGTDVSVDAGL